MCAIVGALVWNLTTLDRLAHANRIMAYIFSHSVERGRDGYGYMVNSSAEVLPVYTRKPGRQDYTELPSSFFTDFCASAVLIGNLRAEPTTEYVEKKCPVDQQPYVADPWAIVHNGTIANDKELRTNLIPTKIDSAAIAERLAAHAQPAKLDQIGAFPAFLNVVRELKGSFAILCNELNEVDRLSVAVNYRPIWYIETDVGVFFASSRSYFPDEYVPRMVTPYSAMRFQYDGKKLLKSTSWLNLNTSINQKALVVCSGGLDSVVSAAFAQRRLGYDVELIHFMYGSRAEGPEVKAIEAVAKNLGVPFTLFPLPVYKQSDSPLLDPNSAVAGGEAGAEFAHEWVPARNLLLLSVATAYAEANGFETIVLGNNLEEAGAYPDNEPEFIAKFNDLLPFAVGDGVRMKVIMPVGNLMKHEIVALGYEIGAPMHLTWSCYRAGALHCGTCGPCYMRRTAFLINNLPEVISYEKELPQ